MYPLRFEPLFRNYIWGGRRLQTVLDKPIGEGDDFAESWEVVDHKDGQSVVAFGDLAGKKLHDLVTESGSDLLGDHHPQDRFPLLFKFLDANRKLSVQVHPDDARGALLTPPDLGKTEAWVILDAEPDSVLYAGLKRGFDRDALAREVNRQTTELCLHKIHPQPGDCIFLPAGIVHAIGAGLVVAEIQQASNTTYRLFDWNRVDKDGNSRDLHIDAALEAIDYESGPVAVQSAIPTDHPACVQLVACDKFILNRWTLSKESGSGAVILPASNRAEIVAVIGGELNVSGDASGTSLPKGQTTLIPAACTDVEISLVDDRPATFLQAFLPS